ncbi:hypothetical protein BH23ACT2_BH23ACT2_17710 [soil metagenome]
MSRCRCPSDRDSRRQVDLLTIHQTLMAPSSSSPSSCQSRTGSCSRAAPDSSPPGSRAAATPRRGTTRGHEAPGQTTQRARTRRRGRSRRSRGEDPVPLATAVGQRRRDDRVGRQRRGVRQRRAGPCHDRDLRRRRHRWCPRWPGLRVACAPGPTDSSGHNLGTILGGTSRNTLVRGGTWRTGRLAAHAAKPQVRTTKPPAQQGVPRGADDRIRTGDPHLGKVMLYQLSHVRVGFTLTHGTGGHEPGSASVCVRWGRLRPRCGNGSGGPSPPPVDGRGSGPTRTGGWR